MEQTVFGYLDTLISRYPVLAGVREEILSCYRLLEKTYENGGKLLVAGNGGSAADAEHVVSELMKGFLLPRHVEDDFARKLLAQDAQLGAVLVQKLEGALPAIALTGHPALSTASINDADSQIYFAQQVNGYGNPGDVFLGISTSGNSINVLYAAVVARAKGLHVVGLTGAKESRLSRLSDVCIRVPEEVTHQVQELHLPIYHCLCMMLEERFFGKGHAEGSAAHE